MALRSESDHSVTSAYEILPNQKRGRSLRGYCYHRLPGIPEPAHDGVC